MIPPDILVIRHGETQWNVAGRLQGRQDTPLTANGVRQALTVGLRLADQIAARNPIAFWVSPLGRARQTASILADIWNVSFERFVHEPVLMERSFGEWEGRSLPEVEGSFRDQYHRFAADRWGYAMPRGESFAALTARLGTWMSSLDPDATHVVVTHSGCLRALRGILTGAAQDTILGYREPQTTAVLLSAGRETLIDVPPGMLRALGCEGEGRTVPI